MDDDVQVDTSEKSSRSRSRSKSRSKSKSTGDKAKGKDKAKSKSKGRTDAKTKLKPKNGKKKGAVASALEAALTPAPPPDTSAQAEDEDGKAAAPPAKEKGKADKGKAKKGAKDVPKRKRGRPRRNPEQAAKPKVPLLHTVASADKGAYRKEIDAGMLLHGRSEQVLLEHTMLSEREFRVWPEHCELDCWWCSKPVNTKPWVIVTDILKHGDVPRVRGRGIFCCPGCVHAWLILHLSVEEKDRLVNILETFIDMVLGPEWLMDRAVPISPDPETLESKGGTRTLEQLREKGGYNGVYPDSGVRQDVSIVWPPLCMGTQYVRTRKQVDESKVNDARSIFHFVLNTPEEEYSKTRYIPTASRHGGMERDPYGHILDGDAPLGDSESEAEADAAMDGAMDNLLQAVREADVADLPPKARERLLKKQKKADVKVEEVEESILDALWIEEDKRRERKEQRMAAHVKRESDAGDAPPKKKRSGSFTSSARAATNVASQSGKRRRGAASRKATMSIGQFLSGSSLIKPVSQKK